MIEFHPKEQGSIPYVCFYRNVRAVGDALIDNNELKCLLGAVGASVSLQDSSQCKLKKMFGSDVTVSIKRVLGEASTANLRLEDFRDFCSKIKVILKSITIVPL